MAAWWSGWAWAITKTNCEPMGIALRSIRERQEMLDEAVRTLRSLWGDAPAAPAEPTLSARPAEPLRPEPVPTASDPRSSSLEAASGSALRQVAEHCRRFEFRPAFTGRGGVQGCAKVYSADSRHCGAGANG